MSRFCWVVALLFLVACGTPAQSGAGNNSAAGNASAVTVTPNPSPSPSATAAQCGWTHTWRSEPAMSAKLQRALQDAGVQGARARVDATGEACGSYFAKQYSTYVIEAAVPDLNDTAHLDALTEKATGVIRALQASSEIRQVNSSWKNRFQINFESGGERKFRPISDR